MGPITRPAFFANTDERADLSFDDLPWHAGGVANRNRYGRFTHAKQPAEGCFPNYGTRWMYPGGHSSKHVRIGPTPNGFEGNEDFLAHLVFKDLGIPKGATITSAVIELWNTGFGGGSNGAIPDGATCKLHIHGIREGRYQPARYVDGTNPNTYNGRWLTATGPLPGSTKWPRRNLGDSWLHDRETTQAKVAWHWTKAAGFATGPGGVGVGTDGAPVKWTTPDVSSVLTEVVGLDGWTPNGLLPLVIQDDNTHAGAYSGPAPTGDGDGIVDPPLPWVDGFAANFWAVLGVPAAFHPRLVYSYTY